MPSNISIRMLRPAVVLRRVAIVLALLNALNANAGQPELKSALTAEFRNQLVILRGFYEGPKLQLNADGNPVGDIRSGYWSSDGMVRVRGVSLEKGRILRLRGKRVVNEFDSKTGTFRNVITKAPVQIEIQLDPSWLEAEVVHKLRERVFLHDLKEFARFAPDYWEWCFSPGAQQKETERWECADPTATQNLAAAAGISAKTGAESAPLPRRDAKTRPPAAADTASALSHVPHKEGVSTSEQQKEPVVLRTEPDGTKVYRAKAPVKPPKPIETPDPEFTEMARQAQYAATAVLRVVINDRGEPAKIHIVRPAGAGLDDEAVKTIKNWKFEPATLDGNPVAVLVDVEVHWRLY